MSFKAHLEALISSGEGTQIQKNVLDLWSRLVF